MDETGEKQNMRIANKRVIITGGAGVIGQELISRLNNLNCQVECFDLAAKPASIRQSVEYIQKDLAQLNCKEFASFNPDVIFHLAATFERTEEDPCYWESNFSNNVIATHNVINAARACVNLKRFIFASSYLVYSSSLYLFESHPQRPVKLRETDQVNPRNLCGSAKYYSEKELEFLSRVEGIPFTTVSARIFRVYGLGSRDVISRWIRASLSGETITVFGEDNSFDYIFAGDVAEGLLRLTESDTVSIVNLGTGISTKIEEVINDLIAEVPRVKIRRMNKKSLVEKSAADLSRLKKETNWVPQKTVAEGIQSIVEFERERLSPQK